MVELRELEGWNVNYVKLKLKWIWDCGQLGVEVNFCKGSFGWHENNLNVKKIIGNGNGMTWNVIKILKVFFTHLDRRK